PPPNLGQLLGEVQFPNVQSLTLRVTPPPNLGQLLGEVQFPNVQSLTLAVTPPPVAGLEPTATNPLSLAPIATANFPTPQTVSVVLVPPASPLSAIASANFPEPQAVSVVLVPPPSPLSAIAQANFPTPQTVSVILVPGPVVQQAPLLATAPALQFGGTYGVQIVQVIPRRGVNFFDRRDPAGQGQVLVARASSPSPPAPPAVPPPAPPAVPPPAPPAVPPPAPPAVPVQVCVQGGTPLYSDGVGILSTSLTPEVGLTMNFNNVFNRVTITRGAIWNFQAGFNPPAGGTLANVPVAFPPGTTSIQFGLQCPGGLSGFNRFALQFQASGVFPTTSFCVIRTVLTPPQGCDALGN
ncbi:MAG: hypothetical protein ABI654_02445, partial [Betaproteobacteria bacterium]